MQNIILRLLPEIILTLPLKRQSKKTADFYDGITIENFFEISSKFLRKYGG